MKGKKIKQSFNLFHPVMLKPFFIILHILNMVLETNMKLIGGEEQPRGTWRWSWAGI